MNYDDNDEDDIDFTPMKLSKMFLIRKSFLKIF